MIQKSCTSTSLLHVPVFNWQQQEDHTQLPVQLMEPPTTRTTPTTGCREDRCPVVSKLPLHIVMQQRCHSTSALATGSLAAHAQSQSAVSSHQPAREDSAPH